MTLLAPRTDVVPTIYEQALSRGVSRRDFLKFCTWMGAYLGLEHEAAAQIARALESKRRIPVVWLHFQECTCCSESFLRSSHPIVADILLDKISLDYTETLQAAAGHQAEEILHDTITKHRGEYLMLVEGSVPLAADGCYCVVGGKSALDTVRELGDTIDLVICDVGMPEMRGAALVRAIRAATGRDYPVLFMSGYSHDEVEPEEIVRLSKPFVGEELRLAVAEALGA